MAEKKKLELYTPEYYAYCGLGGILSCGLTHTAVTPIDLLKCRKQVRTAKPENRHFVVVAYVLWDQAPFHLVTALFAILLARYIIPKYQSSIWSNSMMEKRLWRAERAWMKATVCLASWPWESNFPFGQMMARGVSLFIHPPIRIQIIGEIEVARG